MIGRTLSHYRIHAALGAGGMGEVYRATDTKLGREVALKVLPLDVASDPERLARFQREARAVAALNHPNVVTLYSVEESEGVHFLTMELIEGQSLDWLISSNGLPAERVIEIAGAMAEALSAAHEKGIVHRDLKPANVMVTNDGRVKVLDFGLAKDVGAETSTDATLTSAGHTQAGVVMGTPAYMSPEQVSGRTLDHRTDIFSLGVLLYEMSAGHRPFEGTSSAELISSILRDSPPAITDLRPELPADLSRIIRRCLEKDPRYRMQTARDVSNEFRDLARAATQPAPISTSTARAVTTPGSGSARAAVREDEGFWVAVLPLKCTGANADLRALAEGLTEEIITGLSRFSYLRVIARGSTAKYSSESGDVRAVGKELGARYVMEGSLRQAGSKLRLAIQLADTASGAQLWAETYERTFSPESVFELQDDLVPRIVATVADQYGVLPRSMSETLRSKRDDALTPHEAVLRAFSYFRRITPEEHALVRNILERAVKEAPDHADSWAMLSMMYRGEFAQGFNARPKPLDRALAAARRALELAPTHALAHYALATVYFFLKDKTHFRVEAERVLSLNPNDAAAKAYLGFLLAALGEWERGCQMVESAMQLNPNCPGYFYFAHCVNSYRLNKYEEALEAVARINMPGYFHAPAIQAAALGQLGRYDEARKALQDLLALRPDFAVEARQEYAKLYDDEHAEHIIEGLRKAGLDIPDETPSTPMARTPSTSVSMTTPASGARAAVREDEGFWVAVLPFKYIGANAGLNALVDGLTDDIITGMSRFSYLRVIARSSTARYANQAVDVRAAAKELGARYVMEGSIRQAGAKIRIAVQLVDAASGVGLWAETYDRPFSPEAMLDLLDDVVPRIVATVADTQGILPHSMTELLRNRDPESLTPYEALLRSFGFHQHVNAAEQLAGRTALERAVKQVPDCADYWAMLSWLYRAEYSHGYNMLPDPMDRSLAAARRALDLAPSNQFPPCCAGLSFFLSP
jgi:TolB-like protein